MRGVCKSRKKMEDLMSVVCQVNDAKKREIKHKGEYYSMYSLKTGEEIPAEHHDDVAQVLHCVKGIFAVRLVNQNNKLLLVEEGEFINIPKSAEHIVMNWGKEEAKGWSEYILQDYQA